MAELNVVALIHARPGSEGVVRDALTTSAAATQDVGEAFAAADGHLAGDVAVHPLRPV